MRWWNTSQVFFFGIHTHESSNRPVMHVVGLTDIK